MNLKLLKQPVLKDTWLNCVDPKYNPQFQQNIPHFELYNPHLLMLNPQFLVVNPNFQVYNPQIVYL